ncbi:hypothetical protein L873DRAFT_1847758 [Choiromyces venosus 120613-1]|uniref:F-box domain-containing protein n=1 Tax=Choiromyces venosus 120613-1 TaxID=1336337 RepID=A0A3N4J253_9PEZI|nr:hypothetical protein L873DRAFT_1847758 [Choiromyces venosus 120613-1]
MLGNFSVYCYLCGGPLELEMIRKWEEATGLKAVSLEEMAWCAKLRVIGFKGVGRCWEEIPQYTKGDESYAYMSGIGRVGEWGEVAVPFGCDEVLGELPGEPDESREELFCGSLRLCDEGRVVAHDNCLKFLNHALGKYRPTGVEGSVNLEVIWKFLCDDPDNKLCTDPIFLVPNYFQFAYDDWEGDRCEDGWIITDFMNCEELQNHMTNPPTITEDTPLAYPNLRVDADGSLFNLLPTEVLTLVLHLLPDVDLRNARLASRTLADIPFTQGFWESRVRVDLPLWEVKYVPRGSKVDWRKVYEELAIKGDKCQIRGWRNRWRMWRLFPRSMVDKLWKAELMERNQWASYVNDKADNEMRAVGDEDDGESKEGNAAGKWWWLRYLGL